MGSKHRFGEEGWGHQEYESRRMEREQKKIDKRNRKNTRRHKRDTDYD